MEVVLFNFTEGLEGFINNGGVPPFGHTKQLRVFVDPDLLQYDEVWAAAGTWNDVFGIVSQEFVEVRRGEIGDIKRS